VTIDAVSALSGAIVPVVALDVADHTEPLADALSAGGITCVEITFRTAAGPHAIRKLGDRPGFTVGAGTVLATEQVSIAVYAGAQFIVSPGFDAKIVRRARELDIAVLAGIATPSELQAAMCEGVTAVKLFPVHQLGGLSYIDALSAPFSAVRFFASGGIRPETARNYVDHPRVFAVGASWMVDRTNRARFLFDHVTEAARAAVGLTRPEVTKTDATT